MPIHIEAKDVHDALVQLRDWSPRRVIEVTPVADGWLVNIRLTQVHDYGRSDFGVKKEQLALDLQTVNQIIGDSIEEYEFQVCAYKQGWRPDHGSQEPLGIQAQGWMDEHVRHVSFAPCPPPVIVKLSREEILAAGGQVLPQTQRHEWEVMANVPPAGAPERPRAQFEKILREPVSKLFASTDTLVLPPARDPLPFDSGAER